MRTTDPLYLTKPLSPPPFQLLHRRRHRLGQILTAGGFIERGILRQALNRKRIAGRPIGTVLVNHGLVEPNIVTDALAHQWGLQVIDPKIDAPTPRLLTHADPKTCIQLGCLPWRVHKGRVLIAISDPTQFKAAIAACGAMGQPVAFVMAQRAAIIGILKTHFRDALEHDARHFCPARFSCRDWSSLNVTLIFSILCGLLIIASAFAPTASFWLIFGWILLFNAGAATLRLCALLARLNRDTMPDEPPVGVTRMSDHRKRPIISIMVPLHKEDKVLPALVHHIGALDYPRELMDVKLLIEEHDTITKAAIARLPSLQGCEVIEVPDHTLKTKPRALNYGLTFCRGDIVGIFDAEDRPRPDQMKMVVEHLWNAPPDVAAVQARLDFYNPRRNWMSRIFTLEYAIWFNVLMRGMRALSLPIPLGGTSVYFRRQALETLGGWDAHNVTEDAELGMRIARAGLKTEMIPSVTMEEANGRFWSWIKQRSRWIKGYLITWAVHMRNPIGLWRDLGTRGFIAFQLLLLGGVTSYLSGPLLIGLWAVGFGSNGAALPQAAPLVWTAAVISMIVGQIIMLCIAVLACAPRDKRHLLPWIITAPIYWQIGAFAALKAVAEMFYRPFFWDKTSHGDQSDQTTLNTVSPIPLIDTDMRQGASIG